MFEDINYVVVIIVLAIYSISFGVSTSFLAVQKGYGGYFWTGFLFGVFGLIYTAGLPLSKELRKQEITRIAKEVSKITEK